MTRVEEALSRLERALARLEAALAAGPRPAAPVEPAPPLGEIAARVESALARIGQIIGSED